MDQSRRARRPLAAAIMVTALLIVLIAVTVMSTGNATELNGLGVTPQTVTLLRRSGIAITEPGGRPAVPAKAAVRVAASQGRQDRVITAFLVDATQPAGGGIGARPRLCWVVLLEALPNLSGNLPAPGMIDLYAVVVDAHSGRFLDGLIAFHGQAHTGVGSE